jgi:hypothetical protein
MKNLTASCNNKLIVLIVTITLARRNAMLPTCKRRSSTGKENAHEQDTCLRIDTNHGRFWTTRFIEIEDA